MNKNKPLLIADKSEDSSIDTETVNDDSPAKPKKKDIIAENRDLNNNLITVKKVDEKYKIPTALKLDETCKKHGFTRDKILSFYTLFKTLWKLTVVHKKDHEVRGVCFEVFLHGVSELSLENKDLIK